jgi:hypothetical protein
LDSVARTRTPANQEFDEGQRPSKGRVNTNDIALIDLGEEILISHADLREEGCGNTSAPFDLACGGFLGLRCEINPEGTHPLSPVRMHSRALEILWLN